MAKPYSLARKLERILKSDHGISATIAELRDTGVSGMRVTAGAFEETISGLITRDKIAALAQRIRANGNG